MQFLQIWISFYEIWCTWTASHKICQFWVGSMHGRIQTKLAKRSSVFVDCNHPYQLLKMHISALSWHENVAWWTPTDTVFCNLVTYKTRSKTLRKKLKIPCVRHMYSQLETVLALNWPTADWFDIIFKFLYCNFICVETICCMFFITSHDSESWYYSQRVCLSVRLSICVNKLKSPAWLIVWTTI